MTKPITIADRLSKFLSVLVFSVIEVAALVGWLILADQGARLAAVAVLAVGLTLEHIVTDNLLQGRPLFNFAKLPLGQIVTFSVLETAIWAAWLMLWGVSAILATAFLAAALTVEHTVSRNVHQRRRLLDRIIDAQVLPHTAVETVSCSAWLVLARSAHPVLAVAVLLVGSVVEHTIAVSKSEGMRRQRS